MYEITIRDRIYQFDIDASQYRSLKVEAAMDPSGQARNVTLVCRHHDGLTALFTQQHYRVLHDDGTLSEVCGG